MATWAWRADAEFEHPYGATINAVLEEAYQRFGEGAISKVDLGGVRYTISHQGPKGWVQRREAGRTRLVTRYPADPVPHAQQALGSGGHSSTGGASASVAGSSASEVFVAGPATEDLASVLRWVVLQPGDWAASAEDPIMLTELGEAGEAVVRLPCHSAAICCTFNRSTVEEAFKSSSKCPSCGQPYALPGPQPGGVMMWRENATHDCDGHRGCGSIEIRYEFPAGVQVRM